MKTHAYARLGLVGWVSWFIVLGITGCQTGGGGSTSTGGIFKTRGVYTTLALTEPGLDLPAGGYTQTSSFGPSETPAGVIVGYGEYNQPWLVSLELVESGSGRSLLAREYYARYGKVVVQPLSIRLSGTYELKLRAAGAELDSCQFTVTRTNGPGAQPVENTLAGEKYARGIFSVSLASSHLSEFAEYDSKFIDVFLNSIQKASGSTNLALFAQRFPGKVVLQCGLDSAGRITMPQILENTLDGSCGEVFQRALTDRSPYAAWPEQLHQRFGADHRDLNLTVHFD